ncbi:MAG: metabolite traffic protein EboE [Lentisphaerae bacterium]|nr:metabolite traffic protein EboE [Lentisphaerota bacterium]
MRLSEISPHHLTYCLNVHPGESWEECLKAIKRHVLPLRDRIAPGQPFGLGLRLSHDASLALTGETLSGFKRFLAENNLYVITINAFPYGAFHGERVKEDVYKPDWRSDERRDYTLRVADIAAALATSGQTISISTVPGSYGRWINSSEDISRMIEQLMQVVAHLARIEAETGCRITLGLEPEPDCFLQTTADTIKFFTGPLKQDGTHILCNLFGSNILESYELIQRHLGVCFDTCHLALQFEPLDQSLKQMAEAGILISKIQISSALSTPHTPAARSALAAFVDPVYLHQVKIRKEHQSDLTSYPDLPAALSITIAAADETWRIHFHVPLYFEHDLALGSTATELSPAFFGAIKELEVAHLEIETYTFDVLPPELRAIGIDESLRREYKWVIERL